jgi:hypothetical protein
MWNLLRAMLDWQQQQHMKALVCMNGMLVLAWSFE